jgi:hypothetical protein
MRGQWKACCPDLGRCFVCSLRLCSFFCSRSRFGLALLACSSPKIHQASTLKPSFYPPTTQITAPISSTPRPVQPLDNRQLGVQQALIINQATPISLVNQAQGVISVIPTTIMPSSSSATVIYKRPVSPAISVSSCIEASDLPSSVYCSGHPVSLPLVGACVCVWHSMPCVWVIASLLIDMLQLRTLSTLFAVSH